MNKITILVSVLLLALSSYVHSNGQCVVDGGEYGKIILDSSECNQGSKSSSAYYDNEDQYYQYDRRYYRPSPAYTEYYNQSYNRPSQHWNRPNNRPGWGFNIYYNNRPRPPEHRPRPPGHNRPPGHRPRPPGHSSPGYRPMR